MIQIMRETGWAKINLALHVRARRADGYHDLETIFAFVSQGDDISVERSDNDRLMINGEFAIGLDAGESNLVMQAVHRIRFATYEDRVPPLAIRLTKNLPVGAGIGGGSADAAAMARLIRDHFLPDLSDLQLQAILSPLGADIAACIPSQTCFGQGTGATLRPARDYQTCGTPILLVNPRQIVSTGPVFQAWDQQDRGALIWGQGWKSDLLAARNDLLHPALSQCPEISDILRVLKELKPWLVRMSGSGATCFALFSCVEDRDAAARHLAQYHPQWWQMAGELR
ncbi:MAG TPA: 4-(cytidine 5'-diphospho)-2-C-methyl-D-erythritol kinase [Sphingopyxis sp.]|nr:4-(cytidine 5'-diphospho)-2-C-methyl-D-erythritol kinase [Sphingopyxis sp.]